MNSKTFLALGDSYTIGEAVEPNERWSHQLCGFLKEKSINVELPQIIAKTGWTSSELQEAIYKANISQTYDLVSLLIGVNNQYRGESVEQFAKEFKSLLNQAIAFANNIKQHVIVVSIPDWGVTPFAQGRDRAKIAEEISLFNQKKRTITEEMGVSFFDITPLSKLAETDNSFNASDGLHPSGLMYQKWARLISNEFAGY
jgi:lysophospholipase L1-like esterase